MTGISHDEAAGPEAGGGARRWWRWGVVAAYMALIFAASSVSAGPSGLSLPDKWVHGGVYAGLSGLILWAMTGGEWRRLRGSAAAVAVAASSLYGLSDETHQLFVPGRQFDLLDLAADVCGAALAAGTLTAWGIISRGSRRTHGL